MTGASPSADVLELDEFLDYLNAHLDPADEQAILATTPKLLALARNRTFLGRFLAESLAHVATFQDGNGYTGPVFLLGASDAYMVRAIAWPPLDQESRTPSNLGVHAYDGDAQVAHNHNFSILTTCYSGPGYETDLYEWDQGADADHDPAQKVDLRFCGRERLRQGEVLFYRAFHHAHVQYAPPEYSVSLNLCVHPPGHELRDQHYIDVKNRTLVTVGGPGNDRRVQLINLARSLGEPAFVPHLESIARTHPAQRVRDAARLACEQLSR